MFQTISRNTQGGTAHHIFSRLFRQLGAAEEPFSKYEKNYEKQVHFSRPNVRNGDNTNLWTSLMNNDQEFYTHPHQLLTINNLLSVSKTDIMPTIHQN